MNLLLLTSLLLGWGVVERIQPVFQDLLLKLTYRVMEVIRFQMKCLGHGGMIVYAQSPQSGLIKGCSRAFLCISWILESTPDVFDSTNSA